MLKCKNIISLLILMACSYGSLAQQISIRGDFSFHEFRLGQEYGVLEDVTTDDLGGVLYLFVDNLALSSDSVVDVVLKDASDSVSTPYAWYSWPGVMNSTNGKFTGITIKGIEAPMTPGDYCKVIVSTVNGAVDSVEIAALHTPELRLANIVPSQDGGSVFLYLRNNGTVDMAVDSIFFNTESYEVTDAQIQVSGTGTVSPGEIEIIELSGPSSYSATALAAIRILYHEVPSSLTYFSSAATRCVDPSFHFGSWHSSGFDASNEYGRKRMRKMGIQMLQGPGNYSLMSDGFNRYHIQTVLEPNFGSPFDVTNAIPVVQQLQDSAMIAVWSIDDEPDLNGKDINQQLDKSLTYMRNDENTSVYINLAMQTKFQRYGFYSDVVGMDHYSAPSAPNIIRKF
ncbi:MAG: hypothetical protein JKY54_18165 [Flavobacteriales bacterium]|nr:hypothetical protein [Flavobacteriales bacterium]